jgi:hypothetical protein
MLKIRQELTLNIPVSQPSQDQSVRDVIETSGLFLSGLLVGTLGKGYYFQKRIEDRFGEYDPLDLDVAEGIRKIAKVDQSMRSNGEIENLKSLLQSLHFFKDPLSDLSKKDVRTKFAQCALIQYFGRNELIIKKHCK